ncbi:hypothetical protein ACFSTC_10595 [Nonomuraea ferruginea]
MLVAVAWRDTTGLTGEALRAATVDGLRSALFVAAAIAVVGVVAAGRVPRRTADAVSRS